MLRGFCGLVLLALVAASVPAVAQQRQEAAKEAFFAGKAAYEAGDFEKALTLFQRSYTLGEQPALLYNISSTLQNLNRPGEAAATLREFLKVRPNDPDRATLEARIANLERSQQLLDRDKARRDQLAAEEAARQKRALEAARTAEPSPGWLSPADADARVAAAKDQERRKRRKTLGIALGVTFGAIAVGTAVTLGVLLSRDEPPKDFDFGRVTVTR